MNKSKQVQLEHSLELLGIEPSHSWSDIEKLYRQLAQKWHPDRKSVEDRDAANSRFIEINAAYMHIRSHYRKTGSIPRRIPTERPGPLLGTKKQTLTKPALYKNRFFVASTVVLTITILFGALLWSLDSRLAENNRGRATAEKSGSAKVLNISPPEPLSTQGGVSKQSSADETL